MELSDPSSSDYLHLTVSDGEFRKLERRWSRRLSGYIGFKIIKPDVLSLLDSLLSYTETVTKRKKYDEK